MIPWRAAALPCRWSKRRQDPAWMAPGAAALLQWRRPARTWSVPAPASAWPPAANHLHRPRCGGSAEVLVDSAVGPGWVIHRRLPRRAFTRRSDRVAFPRRSGWCWAPAAGPADHGPGSRGRSPGLPAQRAGSRQAGKRLGTGPRWLGGGLGRSGCC